MRSLSVSFDSLLRGTMRHAYLSGVFSLTLILQAFCLQPADLFTAFQEFLQSVASASSVSLNGNSSMLSTDCIGRIDMIITLTGVESNTEFLYGIPYLIARSNTTQLIGVPLNATVESLSIQHSVVAASVIFYMHRELPSMPPVPLQVDIWMHFTDDLKVDAYDFSLRRFDSYLDYAKVPLGDSISEELPPDPNGSISLIAQRAMTDICEAATTYCTNGNSQFSSFDDCYDTLSSRSVDPGLDVCRYIYKDLVSFRPNVHCPRLGFENGLGCGMQNYTDLTTVYPFTASLLSVNVTGAGTEGLPADTLEELMRMNMLEIYPTTVAFYGIPIFLYILLLYVSGKFIEIVLLRFSSVFVGLSFANRRNTSTYAMNAFYTTVALALQLYASPVLLERYTVDRMGAVRVSCVVISGLYLFELIYRPNMRWPLLIHHFCTLFSVVFLQVALQIALNPAILVAGYIWLFQATTEQSIFIGLLMYRLRYRKETVQRVLKFAAVQSFIFKLAFAVYLLIWWGAKLSKFHEEISLALSVMLVLIASTLMATQVYGSYATWCIATNMDKRATRALVIPRPSQPTSYIVDESFEYRPLAHSRTRSIEKADTIFDPESFMTVPFFADAKLEPIEVSNPTISFSPYDFSGPPGGRDSVLMFGSDQTRLGTERRSYNRTSLPM